VFLVSELLEMAILLFWKCVCYELCTGRIKQLIAENALRVESIRIFILDEADKLLESGFQEDIKYVNKFCSLSVII